MTPIKFPTNFLWGAATVSYQSYSRSVISAKHGRLENIERRLDYLRQHFTQVRLAMHEGVDIRGYFVWSLMDNFEWAHGYTKRFGIIHVDYETQKRTIKDSGQWYAGVIRNNAVE